MSDSKLVNLFVDLEPPATAAARSRRGRSSAWSHWRGRAVFGLSPPWSRGQLLVTGDALDNTITISRDDTGTILVNTTTAKCRLWADPNRRQHENDLGGR